MAGNLQGMLSGVCQLQSWGLGGPPVHSSQVLCLPSAGCLGIFRVHSYTPHMLFIDSAGKGSTFHLHFPWKLYMLPYGFLLIFC